MNILIFRRVTVQFNISKLQIHNKDKIKVCNSVALILLYFYRVEKKDWNHVNKTMRREAQR